MKILAVASTINMKYRQTAPTWWQLLKNLSELGNEVIVTPYLGDDIESPWWGTAPNPCLIESKLYNWYLDKTSTRGVGSGKSLFSFFSKALIDNYVKPKWEKHLARVCYYEDIDVVLMLSVPLNHFTGIPRLIRSSRGTPFLYYDADLPMSLPEFEGTSAFKFSQYRGADLGEYDIVLSCSKGILGKLEKMGAKRAECLYYAADPNLYRSVGAPKQFDIFFYGHRLGGKEQRLDYMLRQPSKRMTDTRFAVAGPEFVDLCNTDLSSVDLIDTDVSLNRWQTLCSESKINLNITKAVDASIFGSSCARIFELAAMNCCMVSDWYAGMEEWFEPGKEMFMVKDSDEAVEVYKKLLRDDALRASVASAAYRRVWSQHTYLHRARQLVTLINDVI